MPVPRIWQNGPQVEMIDSPFHIWWVYETDPGWWYPIIYVAKLPEEHCGDRIAPSREFTAADSHYLCAHCHTVFALCAIADADINRSISFISAASDLGALP